MATASLASAGPAERASESPLTGVVARSNIDHTAQDANREGAIPSLSGQISTCRRRVRVERVLLRPTLRQLGGTVEVARRHVARVQRFERSTALWRVTEIGLEFR